ncbi:hypothetical protein [Leptothermofonsia sp. ETS-13]|uniref:hypothetical protein n=1 Tax=Leptothermofonsia sp. ETS-13 TaxID=3035696 RepID=UPI003B9F70EE
MSSYTLNSRVEALRQRQKLTPPTAALSNLLNVPSRREQQGEVHPCRHIARLDTSDEAVHLPQSIVATIPRRPDKIISGTS